MNGEPQDVVSLSRLQVLQLEVIEDCIRDRYVRNNCTSRKTFNQGAYRIQETSRSRV